MIDLKSFFRIRRTERQQIVSNLRELCNKRDLDKRPKGTTSIMRQVATMIESGRV